MAKECNFQFLSKIDKNLYGIANDAEQLYCDEYFEQCMVQTRRFAENVCRNITKGEFSSEETFDEILATLKDRMSNTIGGKEFISDLYFLKKAGNQSAHSAQLENDGIKALECLQRAFEVAINFALLKNSADQTILSLQYDENLLITGKRSKEKTLQQKYVEEKQKEDKKVKNKKNAKAAQTMPAPTKPKPKQKPKQKPMPKPKKRRGRGSKSSYQDKSLTRKITDIISVICIIFLAILCLMAFI